MGGSGVSNFVNSWNSSDEDQNHLRTRGCFTSGDFPIWELHSGELKICEVSFKMRSRSLNLIVLGSRAPQRPFNDSVNHNFWIDSPPFWLCLHKKVKGPKSVLWTFTFLASPLLYKGTISFSFASRDIAKTPDRRGHFSDLRQRPTRTIPHRMADQEFCNGKSFWSENFSQPFGNNSVTAPHRPA
jgi:hypothetical protein